jgi:hypothetical protein
MNKHINIICILFSLLFAANQKALASDNTPNEFWITGEPFLHDGVLLYKSDKPVQTDTMGNVLLLGVPKSDPNSIALLMKAAEKHLKLRLFGVIQPYSGGIPVPKDKLPNLQFIVWKMHMPSDPDELPEGQKILRNPADTVPGYSVYPKN